MAGGRVLTGLDVPISPTLGSLVGRGVGSGVGLGVVGIAIPTHARRSRHPNSLAEILQHTSPKPGVHRAAVGSRKSVQMRSSTGPMPQLSRAALAGLDDDPARQTDKKVAGSPGVAPGSVQHTSASVAHCGLSTSHD